MEAAINYFPDNSISYDGVSGSDMVFPSMLTQGSAITSAFEFLGAPIVGFSQAKPKYIRIVVDHSSPPVWLRNAAKNMQEIVRLDHNWDTYGAEPVAPELAMAGLHLLSEVMESKTLEPAVVPVSTGGIQFEWHKDQEHFEVEILSPTDVRFYFSNANQEIEEQEEISVLIPKIRDQLTNFVQ